MVLLISYRLKQGLCKIKKGEKMRDEDEDESNDEFDNDSLKRIENGYSIISKYTNPMNEYGTVKTTDDEVMMK